MRCIKNKTCRVCKEPLQSFDEVEKGMIAWIADCSEREEPALGATP